MAWQKNGTPDTLGSPADDLDIIDLTPLTINQFMVHMIASGDIQSDMTVDNNSNTDYAIRRSTNGGTDVTETNQTLINFSAGLGQNDDRFVICYGINIDAEEKLFQSWTINPAGSGAGTPPDRNEVVGKEDTTTVSGQFTRIDVTNPSAGSYDTDSNISALGTD